MSEATKKTVRALLAAMSDGRLDDAEALLDPAGTWWMLANRTAAPAPAWFAGYRRAAAALFTDGITFDVAQLTAEEDRVAAQVECRAVLPNGTTYHNMIHFLFRVGDDRVIEAWEYGDTLHADRVLRPA
jgi:ketosteroid isomerase-like protein